MNTEGRTPAFADDHLAQFVLDELRRVSTSYHFEVLAYTIMPDHVHLVVQSPGERSVLDFIRDFKQRPGFRYKQATHRTLWQKGSHDRVVRKSAHIPDYMTYVFQNPVRRGLVREAIEYRWSGSFVWDRSVMMEG